MSQTPRLPVPDLAETCERYLKLVRPLLSDEAFEKTAATTRNFESGKGKELQAALQQFAAEVETSWLIDAWLDSYLRVRTPLPLASNVGFNIQTQGKGLAEWASALAAVCADYHHQRIPVPQTPQGTPVCMEQWKILQGAARVPQKEVDSFHFAPNGSRHIGILHNGFYYRIAALDEQFEAYHPDAFRQALEEILSDTHQNKYPVAVPCYLGGNETARVYQALQQHDDSTKRLYLHCEHTWADGGALKGIVTLAAAKLAAPGGKKTRPAVHRYEWQLDADLLKNWEQWQQNYAKQADQMHVTSVCIPFNGSTIPKGVSQDALMQFLLQYAQLTTYGSVRNTYEAVDVSHFKNGRTECVRPVSNESLVFVSTLLQEKPSREALDAALLEHKARIKASKLGQGANRHLLGLQLMAAKANSETPEFFKDEGYQTFTTDFLSTSTVGDNSTVVNFAFAPTSVGGLGINYTITPEGWLYTVSHTQEQQQKVNVFVEALKVGGKHLLEFLNT